MKGLRQTSCAPLRCQGFTLLELAIVLMVMGLLLQQVVAPWGAMQGARMRHKAEKEIDIVLQTVVGYAMTHLYLPCPASDESAGHALGVCPGKDAVGYVPAVTLGLAGPLDEHGRLLDPWGRPYRYAVSASDHAMLGIQGQPDYTTPGEMVRLGMDSLEPELRVCKNVAAGDCRGQDIRANQLPVVVLSTGARIGEGPAQLENTDGDSQFVDQVWVSDDGVPFDDIVGWISESWLNHALVQVGFGSRVVDATPPE